MLLEVVGGLGLLPPPVFYRAALIPIIANAALKAAPQRYKL
jgi:hypothetical protein